MIVPVRVVNVHFFQEASGIMRILVGAWRVINSGGGRGLVCAVYLFFPVKVTRVRLSTFK